MDKQDYLDQVDVTPVEEHPRVEEIQRALDENKREVYRLGQRRDELRDEIPALETKVANLEADVEVGDATEEEFEEAKDELESLRAELEQVERRLDTLGKVRDRLQGKRAQAVEEASLTVMDELRSAASDAMDALCDALDDAEEARQRLREINDFARHEPDAVEVPAAASNSNIGKGLATYGHSGNVSRTHDNLKQTFGSDE